MDDIRWQRYPRAAECEFARAWLQMQANLGLAANTLDAYARAVDEFLAFSAAKEISVVSATKDHIAAYVRDLTSRPNPRGANVVVLDSGAGLANATLQQRLTAVRLFYDYFIEEGLCSINPVGRGCYTPGKGFGGAGDRRLIPRFAKLPWIPNDQQWQAVLQAAQTESFRNRVMLALSYDSALTPGGAMRSGNRRHRSRTSNDHDQSRHHEDPSHAGGALFTGNRGPARRILAPAPRIEPGSRSPITVGIVAQQRTADHKMVLVEGG
jgi:hypothetical protein